MNTLDERILIPAPPAVVWEHISDLARNPTWHVDCTNISFLTTFHKGQDVRWRYSGKNRHDYVVQVTAWYEGLGYEYTYIDGVSYKQNKGRIRLQEIPEGTIVQWTFSYELGGALSGLRDAIGHKRNLNNMLIDSLKKLWLYMKHVDRGNIAREPKSLMRDAPDVEARAQYKPRHPSAITDPQSPAQESQQQSQSQPAAPISIFDEPPIAEDDTRPRPAAKVEFAPPTQPAAAQSSEFAPPVQPETAKEPDFMSAVSTSQDIQAVSPLAAPETPKPSEDQEPDFLSAVRVTQDMIPAVSKDEPAAQTPPAPPVSPEPPVPTTPYAPPPPSSQEMPAVSIAAPQPPAEKPIDAVGVDTAKVSIFELFGLPKPSETQEMRTVTSTSLSPVIDKPMIVSITPRERRGIRIMMRRRIVKIRRP